MQVHPDFQRKGLGSVILKRFDRLLIDRGIREIFCMPYTHLEDFYGQIGFKRIVPDQAPPFLQQRLEKFMCLHDDEGAILMRRTTT